MPVVPILSMLASAYLMLNLPLETWYRFFIWMWVGTVIYFLYGYRRSRVAATTPGKAVLER